VGKARHRGAGVRPHAWPVPNRRDDACVGRHVGGAGRRCRSAGNAPRPYGPTLQHQPEEGLGVRNSARHHQSDGPGASR
jgi:hypothetical protein